MGQQRVKAVAAEVGGPITIADLGTARVPRITTPQDSHLWARLYEQRPAAPAATAAAVGAVALSEVGAVQPSETIL